MVKINLKFHSEIHQIIEVKLVVVLFILEHIFPSAVARVDSIICLYSSLLLLSFSSEKTANGFTAPAVMSVNYSKSRPQRGTRKETKLLREEREKRGISISICTLGY